MILTQIELNEIQRQVGYEPDTGHFFYLNDRTVERQFKSDMAVPKQPKIAHKAGDRADKIYANQYVGVYVLKRVINAAHLALYFITGHWPEAVKYRNGDWGDIMAHNLSPITRSQQTTEAAMARYEGFQRKLPANIYGTSAGKFVAKRGSRKTKEFESVREAIQAMEKGRWL